MRILSLSILLALAVVGASAAGAVSISGKWKLHVNVAGNESDSDCTFAQKGTELTGSCASERGTVQISGKVEDKSVTWVYKSEYNGGPLTVTYKGAVESATIKGTVNVAEYGVDGEFSATQVKE